MGSSTSKQYLNEKFFSETFIADIGCDDKGTVLCKDEGLPCLNGGVCALYISDIDDKCIKRCKCPDDYIGDYCQFYAGFYSATIGLVIGLFVTLLIILFAVILIWYCCARKKRREKENSQAERLPPRTCLSNRIDRNNMIYGSNRAMVNNNNILNNGINENDVTPYASFVNLPPGQTRGYSTSQSFSVYENVGVGEEFESTKYALNGQPSTYTYETEGQVHLVEIDNSFETHLNKNVTDDKESSYSEYGLINDRSVTTQSMLPNQRKMIS
ncbi:epidermal growth factor isoform 2 [Schistosoma japonicum]|uniref:Epidermal growth factor isoform 2 n=1 Tax=Schistosoma japonicum TaxID=6182 RepID=A0A4Z2DRL0_SCHJA|nr:epidermal growth factor isoform 2 [Schistosoma japonicum]